MKVPKRTLKKKQTKEQTKKPGNQKTKNPKNL